MLHSFPILACGNMGLTGRDVTLILLFLASWAVAFILFFVNLGIVFYLSHKSSFRFGQIGIFLAYAGLTAFLFWLAKYDGPVNGDIGGKCSQFLALAIPFVVIGHFIYLCFCLRRFRRAGKVAGDGGRAMNAKG